MVGNRILLTRCHLLVSARHGTLLLLLLKMVRVLLAWGWLEMRLHRHARLEALMGSLLRHHWRPRTALEARIAVLLHVMRHVRLGM